MSPLRDFSDKAKQDFIDAIRQVYADSEEYWISDSLIGLIEDPKTRGEVEGEQFYIRDYHNKIEDLNGTTRVQLERIWEDVYGVEARSLPKFELLGEEIDALTEHFQELADMLDPNSSAANGSGLPPLVTTSVSDVGTLHDTYSSPDRAWDLRMQDQIDTLNQDPRFSQAAWDAATPEEREKIIEEYYAEVQRIMGTNANPDIEFVDIEDTIDPVTGMPLTTYGSYNDQTNKITLNSKLLQNTVEDSLMFPTSNSLNFPYSSSSKDRENVMRTIAHETRHAYQHESVANPSKNIVSDETVKQWSANFKDYRNSEKHGLESYESQPVEYDAKKFAKDRLAPGIVPDYPGTWENKNKIEIP